MLINRYLQKLYETFRDVASAIIKSNISSETELGSVVLSLYTLFKVPHIILEDRVIGPKRFGKIDLTLIGYTGSARIDEYDPIDVGEKLDKVSLVLGKIVDSDSLVYTSKYYGYRLSRHFRTLDELVTHIESNLSDALHAPKIYVEERPKELYVIIEYAVPIAFSSSVNGSLMAFSIASLYERLNGYTLVYRNSDNVDEYTLESVFEFV